MRAGRGTARAVQDHIADTPAVLGGAATAALAWLPPAGFLPAATDWAAFLGPRAPAREVALAAADAPDVLAGALRGDAVDLSAAATPGAFRVYRIDGSGGPLLFVRESAATCTMPSSSGWTARAPGCPAPARCRQRSTDCAPAPACTWRCGPTWTWRAHWPRCRRGRT